MLLEYRSGAVSCRLGSLEVALELPDISSPVEHYVSHKCNGWHHSWLTTPVALPLTLRPPNGIVSTCGLVFICRGMISLLASNRIKNNLRKRVSDVQGNCPGLKRSCGFLQVRIMSQTDCFKGNRSFHRACSWNMSKWAKYVMLG